MFQKEKLISGGVALSLLDHTASHFFQMNIGMSNDLLLPLDEVVSPYILKNVGKMMQFENYRTGRIIVKFSLLSASLGLMQPRLECNPSTDLRRLSADF